MTNKNALCSAVFIFLLVMLNGNAKAEDASDTEKKLLTDIMPNSCNFSGQFVQKKAIKGLPIPLQSNGEFFFSCDLGLIWRTSSPFEEALLFANGATHFRIDEHGEHAPLSGMVRYSMSRIFIRLLQV